ncbi:DUF4190 domain-containing protein [Modestobacter sp. VKM Ac-2977]|uniref:DUF4190 domain-containing protein n=1 Tax=Modestobacter sp. VKM Ac-2977 TaxID=3004131 RepID=UPI0022AA1E5C|nr:DUF4190 domain-containing protein [Modestobacter sp. VKM Ac-2977]MCZ2819338.1 DUF4190 domain-containing protein [Modestobacter sp. VKM Ac-2977]
MSQDDFYRGDPPPYGAPPGYGPPGYGPPGYGPPGYGTPAYGPPRYGRSAYGPGWQRPTNQLAIVALFTAFVFAPVGLVLGLVAGRQVRRTGERGGGLAVVAVIVGGIVTTFMVIGLVAYIWVLASISDGAFAP